MNEVNVIFFAIIQNYQIQGQIDERDDYLEALVRFRIDDTNYECLIRQPQGGTSFTEDPIELRLPEPLQGKLNYEQFRQAVENYYRNSIQNSIGSNISMINNLITRTSEAIVETTGLEGGW